METAARQLQVLEWLDNVKAKVEAIKDTALQLDDRTSRVTREKTPEVTGDAKDMAALVPLAEDLRKLSNELNFAHDILSGILDRLEV